jgi:hypothetical protein
MFSFASEINIQIEEENNSDNGYNDDDDDEYYKQIGNVTSLMRNHNSFKDGSSFFPLISSSVIHFPPVVYENVKDTLQLPNVKEEEEEDNLSI